MDDAIKFAIADLCMRAYAVADQTDTGKVSKRVLQLEHSAIAKVASLCLGRKATKEDVEAIIAEIR